MVDVVGVENACIGTDTKMAIPVGSTMRFGKQTNALRENQPEGFFSTIAKAMLEVGFSEKLVEIGRFAEAQFKTDFLDWLAGIDQQTFGFQHEAVVDDLLGRFTQYVVRLRAGRTPCTSGQKFPSSPGIRPEHSASKSYGSY